MLARKHRFHGHTSVSKVRGRRFAAPYFSVYAAKTKRDDFRMAVVVSKKTAASAVTRNRIRRRLYESVRTQKLLHDQPVDVVFVVHKDALATMDSTTLDLQVSKVCQSVSDM